MESLKFLFFADLGVFNLNANVSSPLSTMWKRSSESAVAEKVEMVGGKAQIGQQLSLSVNMYCAGGVYQEKKSLFSFTMHTPKGQKQAGVVYVDLAKLANERLPYLEADFPLEKCPVKNAFVHIRIRGECVGKREDTSILSVNASTLEENQSLFKADEKILPSNISQYKQDHKKQNNFDNHQNTVQKTNAQAKQNNNRNPIQESDKDSIISKFEAEIKLLKKQKQQSWGKQKLALVEQLTKSKAIQNKLQEEVNKIRCQNIEHEKDLERMRVKLQQVYETLCITLNTLY